jgi:hypothetical protein
MYMGLIAEITDAAEHGDSIDARLRWLLGRFEVTLLPIESGDGGRAFESQHSVFRLEVIVRHFEIQPQY